VRSTDGSLVNDADGTFTARQAIEAGAQPVALAIDPDEGYLLVAAEGSSTLATLSIASDGTLAPAFEVPTGLTPADVELRITIE
jgi:DNA-binding beta-propeller fold protein YncE